MSDSGATESKVGKVLLIGVTGGTGGNVIKGFREQQLSNLRAITRKIDLNRPSLSKMSEVGVELVEANLDDENSLAAAMNGISAIYCHATSADSAKPDPLEVERAKRVAQAAKQAEIKHFVYNSAGGADRNSGIPHIEQKYKVEQILSSADLPTTMLRACLFMEEFWKKYTRPSILKGAFPFSIQPDKPLHLITTIDMGRVAAYVMKNPDKYIGQEIELAGDVLTPKQLAEAFSQAQGTTVVHKETPAWIFLLLFQKELYALIQWYRHKGYQADVQHLRQEFPGLLTTFDEFLQQTNWANKELTYESLSGLGSEE
ncbi:NmrA family NAD(P)-binding protein [Scytonema hofmannii FACHB-248]|uniref:NmrA family NAD(P)-binding protein n=1 Tax=Scytonema hofmannii FACHB-248 TaxID=1842502 RepID=A0ABR8GWH1_9CYAN|nr:MULTISPECIES: NmrA family NAD(P)-binding protein [Nostocales]MBD2607589.1 NmrA family NAD(P)-binding protein [Scytonema hofmannii FACHB-248]